ncbi:hypothetical protein NLI96_g7261 [Meripilus lineatus]|uniref:Uncharacterized protein n=1 Tax=Meripilus lineatus TaxID=2056292 RepID=A0AAD5UZH2_9APHY|nr:hypothetical protein NLI96_g7261 [Physisporinus lineatus]
MNPSPNPPPHHLTLNLFYVPSALTSILNGGSHEPPKMSLSVTTSERQYKAAGAMEQDPRIVTIPGSSGNLRT